MICPVQLNRKEFMTTLIPPNKSQPVEFINHRSVVIGVCGKSSWGINR